MVKLGQKSIRGAIKRPRRIDLVPSNIIGVSKYIHSELLCREPGSATELIVVPYPEFYFTGYELFEVHTFMKLKDRYVPGNVIATLEGVVDAILYVTVTFR
jgi:hypothetical protein